MKLSLSDAVFPAGIRGLAAAMLLLAGGLMSIPAQVQTADAQTVVGSGHQFVPPAEKADPHAIGVEAINKSEPVLCAEKDNIRVDFISPQVRHFRVQAVHPPYIGTIVNDRWAPDFTACDMTNDPSFASKARKITFWETPEFWITGFTFPSFWRPGTVPVRVGDRVEEGLHLIQFWMRYRDRAEEVLVLYPPDGYWRARPLPFADMRMTAYGSSFLVGPVEVQERPIVAIKDISFDPATLTFALNFVRGGSAQVKIEKIDQEHLSLDVNFSGAMPDNMPFAALRSMYATEYNSDVARAAWRTKGGDSWGEAPIMQFRNAKDVVELWAGRVIPSKHNTSAPDMIFGRFSTKAPEGK